RKMTQHKHVGSSLNDLLESDGTLEQAEAEALKRVIVWQIQQAMGQTGVNKSQLAQKMHTSRTVVNRLLDEKDTGVTITTLVKAGRALGMTWTLESDGGNGSPRAA
ncbi:helix-turn-helix domain-containing protein, partial [Marinobacter sp.]|uniref:helix-turn-helix domain-containing protein n=2 Tax=Marinobacter sp. TaxID=50741 RepID=UPI0035679D59